jgi:hypothetical protein
MPAQTLREPLGVEALLPIAPQLKMTSETEPDTIAA